MGFKRRFARSGIIEVLGIQSNIGVDSTWRDIADIGVPGNLLLPGRGFRYTLSYDTGGWSAGDNGLYTRIAWGPFDVGLDDSTDSYLFTFSPYQPGVGGTHNLLTITGIISATGGLLRMLRNLQWGAANPNVPLTLLDTDGDLLSNFVTPLADSIRLKIQARTDVGSITVTRQFASLELLGEIAP